STPRPARSSARASNRQLSRWLRRALATGARAVGPRAVESPRVASRAKPGLGARLRCFIMVTERPDEEAALRIDGLSKSYRVGHLRPQRKLALHDLTLSVPRGEIFGYLGPNGSGKTTTLKVLMGLAFADAGGAWLLGRPVSDPRSRHRVGYLPENPYLYDYLTPADYLDYVGQLFGMAKPTRRARARELLERVGLVPPPH